MTTYYSSAYGQNPSDSTNYIYKGPMPERSGQICVRRVTFTGVLSSATTDTLKLFNAAAGERLLSISNQRSGDPDAVNDFTFNLGWTSAQTAVASASTGMQATTAVKYDDGDLILVPAAQEGDAFELNAAAGEAEVSATHTFVITSYIP